MGTQVDVVAVGTLNVDLILIGNAPRDIEALQTWFAPSTLELTAAGSMGYCAVDMARLGLRVSLLSSVADDFFGEWMLRKFEEEGVDTSAVSVERGTASGVGVYMLLFGDPKRPLTGRLASHTPWPKVLSPAQEERLRAARLLHCGGYLHYPDMWGAPTERLYRKARSLGLTTSMDTQFPLVPVQGSWKQCFGGLLEQVDWLFTDEAEARSITGCADAEAAADDLLAAGPELVIVKRGAEGALLATRERKLHQPAYGVDHVTDTIGAGDAFDAGAIYACLEGWDLERTARFASAVAAMTLRGVGGAQTAPSLSEVEAYLAGAA